MRYFTDGCGQQWADGGLGQYAAVPPRPPMRFPAGGGTWADAMAVPPRPFVPGTTEGLCSYLNLRETLRGGIDAALRYHGSETTVRAIDSVLQGGEVTVDYFGTPAQKQALVNLGKDRKLSDLIIARGGAPWLIQCLGLANSGTSVPPRPPVESGWVSIGKRQSVGARIRFACPSGWTEAGPNVITFSCAVDERREETARDSDGYYCYRCVKQQRPLVSSWFAAQSAGPMLAGDGRWYAPDGLGGALVWNGAGWCRT